MTAPAAPQPLSVDDLLDAKKRHTETIIVAIDDDATVTFTFEALGRVELRDLRLDHQPTADQKKQARREQREAGVAQHKVVDIDHNPDTFPPALLAATCVSHPTWTEADWKRILESDRFSSRELDDIWATAIRAQTTRARVDPEA